MPVTCSPPFGVKSSPIRQVSQLLGVSQPPNSRREIIGRWSTRWSGLAPKGTTVVGAELTAPLVVVYEKYRIEGYPACRCAF